MVDEMPQTLPLAGEDGEVLPPNSCPECAAEGTVFTTKTAQALGSHRQKKHGVASKADRKKTSSPGTVNLNVNVPKPTSKAGKDAARLAKTAQGAESFANMTAAGLTFINQTDDASIVAANAAAFGAAIGELAIYQPWLSTIFAPGGEMTGEVAAWLGLLAVTGAIVVPIGARHGWIPEKYAAAFGVAVSAPTVVAAENEPHAA